MNTGGSIDGHPLLSVSHGVWKVRFVSEVSCPDHFAVVIAVDLPLFGATLKVTMAVLVDKRW
jgi:hypothetical protein